MKGIALIPALLALATFANAFGATFQQTLSNSENKYLWSSPENWGGTLPANGDAITVTNGDAAWMEDVDMGSAVFTTFGVGRGATSNGSLTISNSKFSTSDTSSGFAIGGGGLTTIENKNSTVSVINNSTVTVKFLMMSRGVQTLLDFGKTVDAYLDIDGTSTWINNGNVELGRRWGRAYLTLGDGTSSLAGQHATMNVTGNLVIGNYTAADDYGIGNLTMGTHSVLNHTSVSGNIGSASSLTVNGGTFNSTNSTFSLLTNSTMVFNGGSGSFKTVTASGAGSTITITNSSSVSAQTLTTTLANVAVSGSTLSVTGNYIAGNLSSTNSTISANNLSSTTAAKTVTLTGSKLDVTGNYTSGVLSANNSTISAGSLTATTAAVTLTGSTLNVTGNYASGTLSATNTTISAGTRLRFGGTQNSTLTNSTINTVVLEADTATSRTTFSGSTINLGSTVAAAVTDDVIFSHTNFINSTISIGANGILNMGRTSLSGSVVTVSQGGHLAGGVLISLANSSIYATNATVSAASHANTVVTLSTGSRLNLTNSYFTVNGRLLVGDAVADGHVWANSTVSAWIWENQVSTAKTILSNTVVNLGGAGAAATAFGLSDAPAWTYLRDGSEINLIDDTAKFGTGRLVVGTGSGSGSMTITGGEARAYRLLEIGQTTATGIVNVTGGKLAIAGGTTTAALNIGLTGTGSLNVSGTGIVSGATVLSVGANGTVNSTLYVGNVAAPLATSYTSVSSMVLMTGAKLSDTVIAAGAPVTIAAADLATGIAISSLTIEGATEITIDFGGISGLKNGDIVDLVTVTTLVGEDNLDYVSQGLVGLTANYAWVDGAGKKILQATIIPEPAASAALFALFALLALTVAIRRRR